MLLSLGFEIIYTAVHTGIECIAKRLQVFYERTQIDCTIPTHWVSGSCLGQVDSHIACTLLTQSLRLLRKDAISSRLLVLAEVLYKESATGIEQQEYSYIAELE